MPRNMSFMLTQEQYVDGSKDVTRRLGWGFLKPGDILNGVEKSQGLKKGEKIKVLGQHEVISTRWEPLYAITEEDVIREGFPDMTPAEFIAFFRKANKCEWATPVNRIEFKKLEVANHD